MRTWKEVRPELYTAEEIRESNLRAAIIGTLIKARQEKKISHKTVNIKRKRFSMNINRGYNENELERKV